MKNQENETEARDSRVLNMDTFPSIAAACDELARWADARKTEGRELGNLAALVYASHPSRVAVTLAQRPYFKSAASGYPVVRQVLRKPAPRGVLHVVVSDDTKGGIMTLEDFVRSIAIQRSEERGENVQR